MKYGVLGTGDVARTISSKLIKLGQASSARTAADVSIVLTR